MRMPNCKVPIGAAVVLLCSSIPSRSAPIVTLHGIRRLSRSELDAAPTISITGIVTLARTNPPYLVLQDSTDVAAIATEDLKNPLPEVGQCLAVRGVAVAGRLSPIIRAGPEGLHIEQLGRTALPTALRLSPLELLGGRYEYRRVEIEGLVRAVRDDEGYLRAEIGTVVGRITLMVAAAHSITSLSVQLPEGARVRIRGVVTSIVNSHGQWVGCVLHAAA